MRRVVGCMTGTSLDGLDAALVEIEGQGLAMRAKLIRGISKPIGPAAATLRALADGAALTAQQIAEASHAFTNAHIHAVRELLQAERVGLISVHGQTVFHRPPMSWQLFSPAALAHATHATVVCDLRAADLAAGGQGAPITPIADWILFRDQHPRGIVNLGGFCNVTLLPGAEAGTIDHIRGRDVCACNHVLNAVAKQALGIEFDRNGEMALRGKPVMALVQELSTLLRAQADAGRSLGSGDELSVWVWKHRGKVEGPDIASSACFAIADVIARCVKDRHELVLAGGGAKNAALFEAIRQASGLKVITTDELAIPVDMREAACMAVLGALSADGIVITLPAVTGAVNPGVAGLWTRPPSTT